MMDPQPIKPLEYASPVPRAAATNKPGCALLLAMLGLMLFIIPPLAFVVSCIALLASVVARREVKRENRLGGTMAIVAITLSSIIVAIGSLIITCIVFMMVTQKP